MICHMSEYMTSFRNYNICCIGWHNIANLTYICEINTTHDVRVCIWNVSRHISRPNSYDMILNWIYDYVVILKSTKIWYDMIFVWVHVSQIDIWIWDDHIS